MADFSILEEMVPQLKGWPNDEKGKLWRNWCNESLPPEKMQWLMRPLSKRERLTLQFLFGKANGASAWTLTKVFLRRLVCP